MRLVGMVPWEMRTRRPRIEARGAGRARYCFKLNSGVAMGVSMRVTNGRMVPTMPRSGR